MEPERPDERPFPAGTRPPGAVPAVDFRLFIESVKDYAIFTLDATGHVASWNAGAQRIKGYRADEVVGRHFSIFYPPDDVAEGKPPRELEIATATGRYEEEGFRVRRDGSRFWANVVITAVRDEAGALLGFAKVTRDLTERKRNDEERLRLVQAQEALRLRDEFLSIASHELKTPLTALQLQIDGIRSAPDLPAKVASRLDRALKNAGRLDQLIDALLDVTRIATGRFALKPEPFDLAASIRDVADRLREAVTKVGCELRVSGDAAVEGTWDRLRVEQVITNLLSNALRYGAGEPIDLVVDSDADGARVAVTDRGIGIAEADQSRIFDRFERAASILNYGGMGLGLYISRQIAEAHGGSIDVVSAPGAGSTFTLRLPRTPPAPTASNPEPKET